MDANTLKDFVGGVIQPESRYGLVSGHVGQWERDLEAHIRLHQIDSSSTGCHIEREGRAGQILVVDDNCLYEIEYDFREDGYVFSSIALALKDLTAINVRNGSRIMAGPEGGRITKPNILLMFSSGSHVEIKASPSEAEYVTNLLPHIWKELKCG